MVKKVCNICNFQQNEFLKIGGRSYCNSCNSEINNRNRQQQEQITLSAYEVEATYEFLYDALEWLEIYIEKADPNWKQKKQLPKTITRSDIPHIDANETGGEFKTSLTGLRSITIGKPQFLLEKLQSEFFSWLDNSGVDVNNCSAELRQFLVDFNSILIGKGEDYTKRRRKEVDENIAKMTPEERKKNFREIIAAYQEPLENEDKVFEAMKGKTYKDVNNESKFTGNPNLGKEKFELIKKRLEISQRGADRQRELEYLNRGDEMDVDEVDISKQPHQKDKSFSSKAPNSNNSGSNLITISLITIILALTSLGIYGIVKKTKKIKKR